MVSGSRWTWPGASRVGDMLDRIREAADNGLANPAAFDVGLAVDGNGIRLEDLSAGGENFTLESLNGSDALWDLGLPVRFQWWSGRNERQ